MLWLPGVLKTARDALLCPKHTSKLPIMQQIKLQFGHEQYVPSFSSREWWVENFFLAVWGYKMQNLEKAKVTIWQGAGYISGPEANSPYLCPRRRGRENVMVSTWLYNRFITNVKKIGYELVNLQGDRKNRNELAFLLYSYNIVVESTHMPSSWKDWNCILMFTFEMLLLHYFNTIIPK